MATFSHADTSNDGTPLAAYTGNYATRAHSPEASAFMDALTDHALDWEWEFGGRRNKRGAPSEAKLRLALTALVGSILLNASRGKNPWTYTRHRLHPTHFTNSEVSARAFGDARAFLKAIRFVEEVPAQHGHLRDGKALYYCASCYRATPALWDLAASHGLLCDRSMGEHFRRPRIPVRDANAYFNAILLRGLKAPGARRQGDPLAIPETPEAEALRKEVMTMNTRLMFMDVSGCDPVTLWRGFTHDLNHGGRWYAEGGSYQTWSGEQRRSLLRIEGEPAAEVDVCASHLTILHGLLSLPLPNGDLYDAVMDFPREVVKAYVAQTIGKGRAVAEWSRRSRENAAKAELSLDDHDAAAVIAAVLARYPFLTDLPRLLGCEAEPRLSSLRLQRIEADALTHAMHALWRQRIPSLPVHDSLMVPQGSVLATERALQDAFRHVAGVVPRLKAK